MQEVESIPAIIRHTRCRVCKSESLIDLFSIGDHYVSDFVEKENIHSGVKCPLELIMCNDCTAVQLRHTAPSELLYKRHYWFFSSITRTNRDALRDVTTWLETNLKLESNDIVIDLGSNDGMLLRSYTIPGLVKVGVEPALNLKERGSVGVDVFIDDFWSRQVYEKHMTMRINSLRWGYASADIITHVPRAKVITALGMLYDTDDPLTFLQDVSVVLDREKGVFIAQLMCLKNMMNVNDVGNICSEHVLFYSLASLRDILNKCHLEIVKVETNNVNGESYRLYIRHIGSTVITDSVHVDNSVTQALNDERKLGLDKIATHIQFFNDMEDNKDKVIDYVKSQKQAGKKIYILGASTKGNTILQYYGLDHTLIDGASERTMEKCGKYTISTGILIYHEEQVRMINPDIFIVLPFTFKSEIIKREDKWLREGGTFLIPLPKAHLVGYNNVGELVEVPL